jgi:hypothetical protein
MIAFVPLALDRIKLSKMLPFTFVQHIRPFVIPSGVNEINF